MWQRTVRNKLRKELASVQVGMKGNRNSRKLESYAFEYKNDSHLQPVKEESEKGFEQQKPIKTPPLTN